VTYTETLDKLATTTEKQLTAAWESWQDGLITEADFYAVALAYLAAAENRATALADTALAAYLSAARRRPVPTLGLVPPVRDLTPELREAVNDETDPGGRVGRTGRAVAWQPRRTPTGKGCAPTAYPRGHGSSTAGPASCVRTSPGTCFPDTRRCTTTPDVAALSGPYSKEKPHDRADRRDRGHRYSGIPE
jgi:hypothetical protein